MDKAWYAAQVLTGEENAVSAALEEEGLSTLVPMRTVSERRCGVWRIKTRAAIPGYVFIEAARGVCGEMQAEQRRTIRDTQNVIRILGDGQPEEIPDGQMEIIRILSHPDNLISLTQDASGHMRAELPKRMREAGARIIRASLHARRAQVEIHILGRRHIVHMGIRM